MSEVRKDFLFKSAFLTDTIQYFTLKTSKFLN